MFDFSDLREFLRETFPALSWASDRKPARIFLENDNGSRIRPEDTVRVQIEFAFPTSKVAVANALLGKMLDRIETPTTGKGIVFWIGPNAFGGRILRTVARNRAEELQGEIGSIISKLGGTVTKANTA